MGENKSPLPIPTDECYRLIAENTNDAISITDLATRRVTYMSPSVARMLGFKPEDCVGKEVSFFMPPASTTDGVALLAKQVASDEGHAGGDSRYWTIEGEAYRQGGSTVFIESRSTFLRDAAGKPVSVVTVARDITERKLVEKALRASELRYRTLFENSQDAFVIVDQADRVVEVNQAAMTMFGYSAEETAALDLRRMARRSDLTRLRRLIQDKGCVRDHELQMRRKDGTRIDCMVSFSSWQGDDGACPGYAGSLRDITEFKRMQRAQRLYIRQVTHAQEDERKRIARELHDDTIQSLAALSAEMQAASRSTGVAQYRALATMGQMHHRIDSVADELARLSRALRPSVLDHLGLVAAVTLLLNDLNETGRLQASLRVIGRERRLSPEAELGLFRIVQEATTNVRKHSGADRAAVTIAFRRGRVNVTVSDNGQGFDVPENGVLLKAGRNAGLIGMRERAQLLSGSFSVASERGRGTTVVVAVPARSEGTKERKAGG